MIKIFSNASAIITVDTNGINYKRGKSLDQINLISDHSILVEDSVIKDFIPNQSLSKYSNYEYISLKDKIILPGLVESHTHTLFFGSRSEEFRQRLNGKSYEEIAANGGGINNTMIAVRNASFEEIINIAKPRIEYFISQGITTMEIKSGYGLDFDNEIKLLSIIKRLNEIYPIDIIATFLGAHAYPPEFKGNHDSYLDLIINKMLPFIAKNNLAEFCDAFCEKTAFSPNEVNLIFDKALELGLNVKLHTDQFTSMNGISTAIKYNAFSVDHLEVITEADIKNIAASEIVCTLLPGVSFFLNHPYAPAKKLIEENAIIALSTDYNPGSSNIANLSLIMSIAALKMGMTVEQVISAVTINAAKAVNRNNISGSLEIGKKADFAVFCTNDYTDIVYNIGRNLNCMTVKNGEIIYPGQSN
ncbi:MAG TPA: imidazolonepropionase [Ignavibacteriaceae bacterium]|nr:imidazolonepropionase [Ignavibacteriaceae bacterium]